MASAISGAAVVNTILDRPGSAVDALRFYRDAQNNAYSTHYRQSVEYYSQERRWPDSSFWIRRSNIDVAESGDLERSLDSGVRLKPPSEVSHVRLAADVRIERRPVLEWPYIEAREVLVTGRAPRGIRFLHDVSVPELIKEIERNSAITDILTGYLRRPEGKRCNSDMVRSALVRLYREGAIIAIEPHESRPGSRES